jgi:hypothetical protein
MYMNFRIIAVVLLIGAAIFIAGCTQVTPPPEPTPSPTSTPQPTETTIPPTPEPTSLAYIPGPMPSNFAVAADVDRNTVAIKPVITVTYRGGRGINYVYSMEVVVTRSDGVVLQDTILRPRVNDAIVLEGTTGTDRVQVFITLVTRDPPPGPYLIFDEEMRFR